jgi:hypothetical protein
MDRVATGVNVGDGVIVETGTIGVLVGVSVAAYSAVILNTNKISSSSRFIIFYLYQENF